MAPSNVDLINELVLDVFIDLILGKLPLVVLAVEHLFVCHVIFINLDSYLFVLKKGYIYILCR